jgi:hypothetical protein
MSTDLAYIGILLVMIYFFILFVLRSFHFLMNKKEDPIKAIIPKPIKWFEKKVQKLTTHEKLDKIS